MKIVAQILTILLLVLFGTSKAQDCLCTLEDSSKYPGSLKWNCQSHGLIAVPTACFGEESENVTELILTDNVIQEIMATDFLALPNLKSLYLDSNRVTTFDELSLQTVPGLLIFNADGNANLEFPADALTSNLAIQELYFEGSRIEALPNLLSATYLTSLDARSAHIATLARPTFGTLKSTDFYLNLYANDFVDIAADILLPIPDGAIIELDTNVIIWAKDEFQHYDVLDKNWNINLDLDESIKICDYDGNPSDPSMC